MHIYISESVIPLGCRYQVVLSSTYKEYSKDMQFLAISPYYNPTTYTSCESLKEHLILDCITFHNHKEKISKNQVIDGRNYFQTCYIRQIQFPAC